MSALPPTQHASLIFPVHALTKFERCQAQFGYAVHHRLNWPEQRERFALGTAVHKLLDYDARGLHMPGHWQAPQDVLTHWQALRRYKPEAHLLASEWGFNLPFELALPSGEMVTAWLTGRIDRVIQDPDGSLIVIDWKTGTARPKDAANAMQTRVYLQALVACWQQLGLASTPAPEHCRFEYVEVNQEGTLQVTPVPYSLAIHQQNSHALHQLLAQMIHAVSHEKFPLPTACPDPVCGYRPICGIEASPA